MKKDIGIDLGTSNTIIYMKSKGIVLDEPSVVAIDKETGSVLAVGNAAKDMVGKTPDEILAVYPLKDGVVADFEAAYSMLKYFIKKAYRKTRIIKPKVIINVPCNVTGVERRAVEDAAISAGAREVYLIESPMAAALGSDLPVSDAIASMIVDIGGGATEIAVISLGGIVTSKTIRIAGDTLCDDIIRFVKTNHNLVIGRPTAEIIKITIATAIENGTFENIDVKGRDTVSGLPKNIVLNSNEVCTAIKNSILKIVDTIKVTLEQTPPELSADILERGIVVSGGSSSLNGICSLIEEETGMKVLVSSNPREAVALGIGNVLDKFNSTKRELLIKHK
ncbi:MAG: rod shape-determining protein [Ruminococcaceae bacterium]|nr:rod shape-determining protein [Oscillospiraceae bacterium]